VCNKIGNKIRTFLSQGYKGRQGCIYGQHYSAYTSVNWQWVWTSFWISWFHSVISRSISSSLHMIWFGRLPLQGATAESGPSRRFCSNKKIMSCRDGCWNLAEYIRISNWAGCPLRQRGVASTNKLEIRQIGKTSNWDLACNIQ